MSNKLALDLSKSAQVFRLQLDKAGISPNVIVELIFIMDVSQSFEHEHEEGTTSVLIQRLVPVAIVLDPDRQIDFITFSNGPENVQYIGTITEQNCEDYVVNNVVERVQGWNGGTTYSYALEEALRRFGWMESDRQESNWSRFWNNLPFIGGGQTTPQTGQKKRSIVIFITDGENDPGDNYGDKVRTKQVLRASQDRHDDVYFLFIGACEHQDFEYVEEIARLFKNTGIVMATDPEEFVELPDEQLMEKLLVPELIEWLKA